MRTQATVQAELAEVDRYLREAPPHASGDRSALEIRRTALLRELAALRAAAARTSEG